MQLKVFDTGFTKVIYSYSRQNSKLHYIASNTPINSSSLELTVPASRTVERDLLYIPYNVPAAIQIVQQAHISTGHGSDNHTLSKLRENFWIPKARKLCKSYRKQCLRCKILLAKFIELPEAPLPLYRYSGQRAFEAVGIDFTGPFHIVEGLNKAPSLCIFSCPYTRVICLEPVLNQNHESFDLAFNHLKFTRSIRPKIIVSDQAKVFKLAKSRLNFTSNTDVKWILNAPRAPWWGAFYERINRIIKDKMAFNFYKRKFPTWQHFQVAVAFLEHLINSRPIFVSSDERQQFT